MQTYMYIKKKIFKNSNRNMTVSRSPIVNRKIKLCATEKNTLTCALMIPTCEANHAHMKS